jgi:hypothetical protein
MAKLPKQAEHCSLTTLQWKPIKIGVKVVRHGRCVTCQFANVAIPELCSSKSCGRSTACGRPICCHDGSRS